MSTTTTTYQGLSDAAQALLGSPDMLIDGQWEAGEGEAVLTALNPSTTEVIGEVRTASVAQAERAVLAAKRAFNGEWFDTTPRERSDLLLGLAKLMDEHRDELVEIVVTEVGSPVALTRMMQVGMPVTNIEWAAEKALTGPQGGYEEALAPHMGLPASSSLLLRQPLGVISAITGYNFPINSVVWKVGPGLAAGCTLVVKPSERTPLSTLAFLRLVDRAGFPPGAVNMVLGHAEVGNLLSTHEDVDMVMFTGSLAVGRKIMAAATESTKRVVLELGGKSANIILPGADLDEVTGPSILRFVRNAGQGCGATTRTFVPRAEYDRFAEASADFLSGVVTGDPWNEKTDVGPLIREEQRAFVEGFVERAVAENAVVVAGGDRPDLPGYFVNPTVVGNVTNDSEICREELFGPVGTILPYDSVEQAVAMAEDNQYGLHAAVWGPITEALSIARRLRTGAVSINGGGFMRPEAPWGGFKHSGFGREMGDDGFREFFEVKHVQWPLR